MKTRLLILILVAIACLAAKPLPVVFQKSGPVKTESLGLPGVRPGNQYSLLYSLNSLSGITTDGRVNLEVQQGSDVILSKVLHVGDADLYAQFRLTKPGPVTLQVRSSNVTGNYRLQVNRWPLTPQVKSLPSHRWQDALEIPLGKTIFAYGDDAEYIPLPDTPRRMLVDDPDAHGLVQVFVRREAAEAGVLPDRPDGARPDSRRMSRSIVIAGGKAK